MLRSLKSPLRLAHSPTAAVEEHDRGPLLPPPARLVPEEDVRLKLYAARHRVDVLDRAVHNPSVLGRGEGRDQEYEQVGAEHHSAGKFHVDLHQLSDRTPHPTEPATASKATSPTSTETGAGL